MKKLFLLLVVIPFLGTAQNILVKWFHSDLQPTLIESHVSSTPITGVINQEWGVENAFYSTNENFSNSPSPDTSKYIQFTVSPEVGYQIKLSNFTFSVRKQGGDGVQKIQVKYSKNSDFSDAQTLLAETVVNTSYSDYSLAFPDNTAVIGSSLYIRIYVYNTYNNLHIQHNQSGSIAPFISGSVSLFTLQKPIAVDDHGGTLKNKALNIDILDNDEYISSGVLNKISATKPPHGTVVVNNRKDVIYTPDSDYAGYDSFYYTLTNAVGESNSAKVEIQVLEGEESVLARWNKADFTSDNYTSGVMVMPIQTAGGVSISNFNQYWLSNVSYKSFDFKGLSTSGNLNGTLDSGKYVQFSMKLALDENAVALNKLNFQYNANGAGNFSIKYSKDPSFTKNVFTLVDNKSYTTSPEWLNFDGSFAAGTVLFPQETIYVRIYIYNVSYENSPFYIKTGENDRPNIISGPVITGTKAVLYPEPCTKTVTWNGTEWNETPTIDKKAEINGDYSTLLNGSFEACTLKVNTGKMLIGPSDFIVLANAVSVMPGAEMIVKSDGNFIQKNNDSENLGIISVERTVNLKKLDYIYWASPVKNQNLKTFSSGTVNNRFYTYNEGTNLFDIINPLTNSFGNAAGGNFESAAKGYAIRANNSYPAATATAPAPMQVFNALFTGTPNNGTVSFPLAYKSDTAGSGNNLVGNPYPSNIDFNMLFENNSDLIEGTAYLWTNINPNPAMQGGNYPNGGYFNNYATLNRIGGIPATKGKSAFASNNPTQIIKIGQAFIVKAKKSGSLIFDNKIRSLDDESVFINKSATDPAPSPDRFWLQLTSPLEVVTTTLVGYREDAQNSFNKDEDAKLLVVGDDALYSLIEEVRLGIQGRKGPLRNDDVVHLGMNHYETGNYTLSLGQRDGIFAGQQAIYLKDKNNGIITNLSLGDYIFTGNAGENTDRFEIIYRQESTLATENTAGNPVIVYRDSGNFVVKAQSKISDLEVYDSNGRLIWKIKPQNRSFTIPSDKLIRGVYLIRVIQNDTVTVKRIIK